MGTCQPERRHGIRDWPKRAVGARLHAPTRKEPPWAARQSRSSPDSAAPANIVEMEPCITRLRTEVKDMALVDEKALKAAGAHGVVRAGTVVQVVVGPEADNLAEDIEDLM